MSASARSRQEIAQSHFQAEEFSAAQEIWLEDLECRRGVGVPLDAAGAPRFSICKLAHDVEQMEYLLERGLLRSAYTDVLKVHQRLLTLLASERIDIDDQFRLPPETHAWVEPTYNRAHRLALSPALSVPAINPRLDFEEIERRYVDGRPAHVFVDGLLTDAALTSLRRMCLESTFWFNVKGAYVGAYLRDGFASGLLFQIASELRARLPKILASHQLREMWAYKYDRRKSGIHAHADDAAVNVNLWITPDAANSNPETGGLVVFDAQAPPAWDFKRFNRNRGEIAEHLATRRARSIRVPHRQNRAVLFDSSLFHATDEFDFAAGYENRRINVTLLYGKRG